MSHCPRCGNLEYAVEREIDRRLKSIEESQERILHELHELRHPNRSFPTSICFKEITMNPTIGGNTQVFTGVLAPSGATYPGSGAHRGRYWPDRDRRFACWLGGEHYHASGLRLHRYQRVWFLERDHHALGSSGHVPYRNRVRANSVTLPPSSGE
jgi:hypothetical protein